MIMDILDIGHGSRIRGKRIAHTDTTYMLSTVPLGDRSAT